MGDSGGTSTTKTEPWSGVQPYLTQMYDMLFGSSGGTSSGTTSGTSSGSSGSSSGSSGSTTDYWSSNPNWTGASVPNNEGTTTTNTASTGTTSSGSSISTGTSLATTPLEYYPEAYPTMNNLGQNIYDSASGQLIDNGSIDNMISTGEKLMGKTVTIDPSTYNASLLGPTYQITTPDYTGGNYSIDPTSVGVAQADYQNLNYGFNDSLNKVASGDYMDVSKNPYLQNAISYAVEPLTRTLTQSTLPGINTDAVSAGRYGSNAWSSLYGNAMNDYERNVLGTSSTMANDAYNKGLDAMVSGLGIGGDLANYQLQSDTDISKSRADTAQSAYNQEASLQSNEKIQEAQLAQDYDKFYQDMLYNIGKTQGDWQSQYDLSNQNASNEASQFNATQTQNAATDSEKYTQSAQQMGADMSNTAYDNLTQGFTTAQDISQNYQDYLNSLYEAGKSEWDFNQMEEWNRLFNIASILYGNTYGTTTSTTS